MAVAHENSFIFFNLIGCTNTAIMMRLDRTVYLFPEEVSNNCACHVSWFPHLEPFSSYWTAGCRYLPIGVPEISVMKNLESFYSCDWASSLLVREHMYLQRNTKWPRNYALKDLNAAACACPIDPREPGERRGALVHQHSYHEDPSENKAVSLQVIHEAWINMYRTQNSIA